MLRVCHNMTNHQGDPGPTKRQIICLIFSDQKVDKNMSHRQRKELNFRQQWNDAGIVQGGVNPRQISEGPFREAYPRQVKSRRIGQLNRGNGRYVVHQMINRIKKEKEKLDAHGLKEKECT